MMVEACWRKRRRESAGGREGQRGHKSRGSDPSPTHPLGTMGYATEISPTSDSSLMPLEK